MNGRFKNFGDAVVIHGNNPDHMSVIGINEFKDFVDKQEFSNGVPMGDVNYKVKKYHGCLAVTHAIIQSDYN